MKRIICLLLATMFTLAPAPLAAAEELMEAPVSVPSPVIITEVQTGSASGSDEFVELYNVSDEAVDVTGWQLRYSNAASAGDGTTLIAELAGIDGAPLFLSPLSYYVVHTPTVPLPEGVAGATYAAKLSTADKVIGLFARNEETCLLAVADSVAWGASTKGEGAPVTVAGSSERLLQRKRTGNGGYTDTDNNMFDFAASAAVKGAVIPQLAQNSTPGSDNQTLLASELLPDPGLPSSLAALPIENCILPPEETPEPTEEPEVPQPTETPPASIEPADTPAQPSGPVMPTRNTGLVAPQLSELLPNPAKPQTDAQDEFVEMYNSNGAVFELSGFILEAGKKRYVFPAGTSLPARTFKAFFSVDTGLSLSNAQGQVRLLDPFGRVISQTEPYQSAKDGQSWSLAGGTWQWSTAPTPNSANSIKAPQPKKKSMAVKSAATRPLAAPHTASQSSRKSPQESPASPASEASRGGIHTSVLAIGGALAILYGAYEYRRDMANKLYQLRTNRAARREARQSPEGR